MRKTEGEHMKKKVYLFCYAGMSTSLLVAKMNKIVEKFNLPIEIEAHSYAQAHTIIPEQKPDCIVLGPQVKFMFDEMKEKYAPIPVMVVDTADYGAMNGEKVLKDIIKVLKGDK